MFGIVRDLCCHGRKLTSQIFFCEAHTTDRRFWSFRPMTIENESAATTTTTKRVLSKQTRSGCTERKPFLEETVVRPRACDVQRISLVSGRPAVHTPAAFGVSLGTQIKSLGR